MQKEQDAQVTARKRAHRKRESPWSTGTQIVPIRMPRELYETAARVAAREGIATSVLIRRWIKEALAYLGEKVP